MVNFICQLYWASLTGYPDVWSNIILSVSLRVFLHEIDITSGDLVKKIA